MPGDRVLPRRVPLHLLVVRLTEHRHIMAAVGAGRYELREEDRALLALLD